MQNIGLKLWPFWNRSIWFAVHYLINMIIVIVINVIFLLLYYPSQAQTKREGNVGCHNCLFQTSDHFCSVKETTEGFTMSISFRSPRRPQDRNWQVRPSDWTAPSVFPGSTQKSIVSLFRVKLSVEKIGFMKYVQRMTLLCIISAHFRS